VRPPAGPGRTRLVLARHGQTVWHVENRYAGTSDVDLTPQGHAQAELLARWAAATRPDAVVCSPVRRARETAGPVERELGRAAVVLADLREVGFGIAEGRTLDELAGQDGGAELVRRFREDPVAHPFPGAEAPESAAARGAEVLRRVAAEHAGQTVLVVAHNTLLRLALCRLIGIEVRRYRTVFPRLDNATLTRIELTPAGETSLVSFNVPLDPIPLHASRPHSPPADSTDSTDTPPHNHPTPSPDGSLRSAP
jgi:probable phosphoglycerate mutase